MTYTITTKKFGDTISAKVHDHNGTQVFAADNLDDNGVRNLQKQFAAIEARDRADAEAREQALELAARMNRTNR